MPPRTRGRSSMKTRRTTRSTRRREPTPPPEREATHSPEREATYSPARGATPFPAREATPPSPPPPTTEAQEQERRKRRPRTVVWYGPQKKQKNTQEAALAIPSPPSTKEHIPPPSRRTEAGSSSHPQNVWEGTEALPPVKLFFPHTEYGKSCKIATKCDDFNTLEFITSLHGGEENAWFSNHPQFQHLWRMQRHKNHKLMGMWMLLLRTVFMEKGKTCWFVVNGVPVRYSLKEHALISGLDCRRYPADYEKLGSLRFVKRHFGRNENISTGEVRGKLKTMFGDGERLKMAVLLFLSTVIKGSSRYGYIELSFSVLSMI